MTVTVVEDNENLLDAIVATLERLGCTVMAYKSVDDFSDAHKGECYGCGCGIFDVSLPDGNAFDCLEKCVSHGVLPKRVLIMSGTLELDSEFDGLLSEMREHTDLVLLHKPFDLNSIVEVVT